MRIILIVLGIFCVVNSAFTQTKAKPTTKVKTVAPVAVVKDTGLYVKITTVEGIIILKLYDETPLHRDNFAKLVRKGFYDSLLWHRVIPQFMIQGGDPDSKNAVPGARLGSGGAGPEKIPSEIRDEFFHKKGALGAASDGNPEKSSSSSQFYLVEGRTFSDGELDQIEIKNDHKFSPMVREIYKTRGGYPSLDGRYTVFGEVLSGYNAIERIANLPKDIANRPLIDIRMKMEILRNMPKDMPAD